MSRTATRLVTCLLKRSCRNKYASSSLGFPITASDELHVGINESDSPASSLYSGESSLTPLTREIDGNCLPTSPGNSNRNFVSSGTCLSSSSAKTGLEPSVQGIQGDDCASFLVWIGRCRKYGAVDCDEQLEAIKSGRKTLGQVLEEQEEFIRKIIQKTEALKNQNKEDDTDFVYQLDTLCPQGIQGDDCSQFKLWLQRCHQFGFWKCIDRLNGIRIGENSVQEIYNKHEELIKSLIAEDDESKKA